MTLMDARGVVVAEVLGLRLQERMGGAAARSAKAQTDSFYRLDWQEAQVPKPRWNLWQGTGWWWLRDIDSRGGAVGATWRKL